MKLRISAISRLVHEKLAGRVPAKRACEKHMLEVEESCQPGGFHESLAGRAFSRDTRETLCFKDFLSVTFLPFTHTIYTRITHKSMKGHSKRKTLDRFSTTHTPIF